jgi:hypothetical protein
MDDPVMAKYDGLRDRLMHGGAELTMTFEEVAELIPGGLPASAFKYTAWWANDSTHVEARAWLDAGRTTSAVDLASRRVTFGPRS